MRCVRPCGPKPAASRLSRVAPYLGTFSVASLEAHLEKWATTTLLNFNLRKTSNMLTSLNSAFAGLSLRPPAQARRPQPFFSSRSKETTVMKSRHTFQVEVSS